MSHDRYPDWKRVFMTASSQALVPHRPPMCRSEGVAASARMIHRTFAGLGRSWFMNVSSMLFVFGQMFSSSVIAMYGGAGAICIGVRNKRTN